MMQKHTVISVLFAALSVALAVVSFLLLPDAVVVQIALSGTKPTTLPKLLAVAIPFLLTAGGALFSLTAGRDKQARVKCRIVSCAGVLFFALMLAVNLA